MWGELRWVNRRSLGWGRIQRWRLLPSSGPREVNWFPHPSPGREKAGRRELHRAGVRERAPRELGTVHTHRGWRTDLGRLSTHQLRPHPSATHDGAAHPTSISLATAAQASHSSCSWRNHSLIQVQEWTEPQTCISRHSDGFRDGCSQRCWFLHKRFNESVSRETWKQWASEWFPIFD